MEAVSESANENIRVSGLLEPLSFVNSLVACFETIDHHPDVHIAYGEVTFELTRYDLGGKVTDRAVRWRKRFHLSIARDPNRSRLGPAISHTY